MIAVSRVRSELLAKKIAGEIPLGAESPTFATRKRMILFSLQSSRISNFLQFFSRY